MLAGLPIVPFGLDCCPELFVVAAEAEVQLGMLGLPVDELPRAAYGAIRATEIPKLFVAVSDDELFYVLIGLVTPANVTAFQDLARAFDGTCEAVTGP